MFLNLMEDSKYITHIAVLLVSAIFLGVSSNGTLSDTWFCVNCHVKAILSM